MNKKDILALENRYMENIFQDDQGNPNENEHDLRADREEVAAQNSTLPPSPHANNPFHPDFEDEESASVVTKEVEVALDKVIKNDLLPNLVAVMHVAGIDTRNRDHLNQVFDYIKQQLAC